jgi:hypothetical protein
MRIIRPSFTILLICVCALSTSACKSLQRERFEINQATIQNDTSGTLHTVRVQHSPTGAVGATNAILPHKALNVGFDGRTLMADSCIISWSDDRGLCYQKEIILPKNLDHDQHNKHLAYHIAPDGTVTAEITDSN